MQFCETVWKIVELVMPDGNSGEKSAPNTDPQPGLMIFSNGYYSQVILTGQQPRVVVAPPKDRKNLTDGEKIARYEQWKSLSASAGSYEIKGSTMSKRSMVTKHVTVMPRETPNVWEFKLEGLNTLWLIPSWNLAATEPRIKLTRLE